MSQVLEARKQGPVRFALGELWNQNFKLVPSGLAFALSLFLLMNNPSFLVKIPAIVLLNALSLHCAARLTKSKFPKLTRKLILIHLAVDIFFLVCLHNVVYFAHAPESTKVVLVSNFCVAFILLAFISVPFAIWSTMGAVAIPKRTIVLAIFFVSVGWLVIFPYVFFGLPFAQLVIVGSARKVES